MDVKLKRRGRVSVTLGTVGGHLVSVVSTRQLRNPLFPGNTDGRRGNGSRWSTRSSRWLLAVPCMADTAAFLSWILRHLMPPIINPFFLPELDHFRFLFDTGRVLMW